MGAPTPTTSDATSLDRLKALHGIDNLPSQLDEARKLCNHSSRAEMILRWLVGKLKTSSDARQKKTSWGLLASCIRMLSAQRLSALLGSGSFMEIVKTATTEPKLSIDTICAITDLWRLLFERGQASGGAPTLSLLSTKSVTAAAIWGNWMGHLRQHCEEDATFANMIIARSLLHLGVQIWSLRKRQPSDHELFNSHCLLPGLLLLRLLSAGVDDIVASRKRKHCGNHSDPENSSIHALQTNIARHAILPARATFFDKDQKKPHRSRRKDVADNSVDLDDTLNSIGQALVRGPSNKAIETVPLLFDLALRAVPTPTPRHRIQERPWLENVFLTLRSLLENGSEGDRHRVTADMVRLIRARGVSLSPKSVSQLASECLDKPVVDGSEPEQRSAWELLSQLIALDSSVFANRPLAERISTSVPSVRTSVDTDFYRSSICLPVMRAFAQRRDLNTFMELWHERLKHPAHSDDAWSLWAGLVPPFADLLCDSRTADQILADIDQYSQGLSTATLFESEALNDLRADAIILDGILRGLRNDDLLDRAWQRMDVLLQKLLAVTSIQEGASPGFYVSLWQLLASLFESWFPSMAHAIGDSAKIAEAGSGILSSEPFKIAVHQCKMLSVSTKPAQHLVACVCARLGHYREHGELFKVCRKSAAALCMQPASSLCALAKYPDVFMLLDHESVVSVLDTASKTSGESLSLMSLLPPGLLGMFVDSKISSMRTMTEKKAKSKRTSDSGFGTQQVFLDLLFSIPLETLTARQRGDVLDALSRFPPETSGHISRLEKRFAAILTLLRYPSEGSELLTDPSMVWSLGHFFAVSDTASWESQSEQIAAFNAMSLLCKIVEAIINLWLKSKAQNREKLLEISSRARQALMTCLKHSHPNITLMLAGSVIGTLETADNTFLQDFAHRDPQVSQILTQMTHGTLAQDGARLVLEVLLKTPHSIIGDSPLGSSPGFVADILKKTLEDETISSSTLQFAVDARAAQFSCRYEEVDGIDLLHAIENVLKRDLSGQDHFAVLQAFETRLQSESSSFRSSIIDEFLKDGPSFSAQALELQRCAITALSKEDFEPARELAAVDILHHVLRQASSGATRHERQLSLQTLKHILKEKRFMVNQFGVEQTISTLHSRSIEDTAFVSMLWLDICQILAVLLTQFLGRLQGRYHLLVALFQQLITTLFSSADSTSRQSTALSRLLQTFCNPPHIPRKRNANNLIDESRKAKAYAGQFVQYTLHHYCSQILTNPPSDDAVREALVPGIWAMIEAIETNNFENGIKNLSAAMNNSERAVLRSVYEEWQRRGKWEGT